MTPDILDRVLVLVRYWRRLVLLPTIAVAGTLAYLAAYPPQPIVIDRSAQEHAKREAERLTAILAELRPHEPVYWTARDRLASAERAATAWTVVREPIARTTRVIVALGAGVVIAALSAWAEEGLRGLLREKSWAKRMEALR